MAKKGYRTKVSGKEFEKHDTGAQRDSREGKGRYDLVAHAGNRAHTEPLQDSEMGMSAADQQDIMGDGLGRLHAGPEITAEMNWRKRENLLYDIYGCLRQACQRLPFAWGNHPIHSRSWKYSSKLF